MAVVLHEKLWIQCTPVLSSFKILVVRRPSVTGGHRKRFDPETQGTVSLTAERKKLQIGDLCERQSWH